MNAYELADFIDKYCVGNTIKESAIMLRQQADRIAELEKGLEDYTGEVDDGVKFVGTLPGGHPLKMSKPVAWIDEFNLSLVKREHEGNLWSKDEYQEGDIPLYTHPVKQLTTERKIELAKICFGKDLEGIEDKWFLMYANSIIKEITK